MLTVSQSALPLYQEHVSLWRTCQDCSLNQNALQKVFCRGIVPAHILFIGEAPGKNEDGLGFPFVGEGGALLDIIVEDSLGKVNRKRSLAGKKPIRSAFTNAVLCHSFEGDPLPKECIRSCSRRLAEFILICKAELLVLVGKSSRTAYYQAIKHLPTLYRTVEIVHPGAILRQDSKDKKDEMIRRSTLQLLEALSKLYLPKEE